MRNWSTANLTILRKVVLFVFTMTISLTTTEVEASFSYGVVSVGTEVVNSSGKSIGVVKQYSVIRLGRETSTKWEVQYNGKSAWVDKRVVKTGKDFRQFLEEHPAVFRKKIRVREQAYSFEGKSVKSKVGPKVEKGQEFLVFGESKSWYKIQTDNGYYWVNKSACSVSFLLTVVSGSESRTRESIVEFALRWVGNPYVWGGTSLTEGADCSGFVQSVFKKFEIELPRTSREQACVGQTVREEDLKPGDLVFYKKGDQIGHVALYVGGGKVVQANSPQVGIVVTSVRYNGNKPAWCKRVVAENG